MSRKLVFTPCLLVSIASLNAFNPDFKTTATQKNFALQAWNLSQKTIVYWGIPVDKPPMLIATSPAWSGIALSWSAPLNGIYVFDASKSPDVNALLAANKKDPKAATAALKSALTAKQKQYPNDFLYFDMSGKPMGGEVKLSGFTPFGTSVTKDMPTIFIGPNMENLQFYNDTGTAIMRFAPIDYYGHQCTGYISVFNTNFQNFVETVFQKYKSPSSKTSFLSILNDFLAMAKKQGWQESQIFLNTLIKAINTQAYPGSTTPFINRCQDTLSGLGDIKITLPTIPLSAK